MSSKSGCRWRRSCIGAARRPMHSPRSIRRWHWRKRCDCRAPIPSCARPCCNRLRPAFDLKISMLSEQYMRGERQAPRSRRSWPCAPWRLRNRHAAGHWRTIRLWMSAAPGLDPTLLERRQRLYRELAARRFRLEARLDRTGTADSQSQAIRSEIATLRQDLDRDRRKNRCRIPDRPRPPLLRPRNQHHCNWRTFPPASRLSSTGWGPRTRLPGWSHATR